MLDAYLAALSEEKPRAAVLDTLTRARAPAAVVVAAAISLAAARVAVFTWLARRHQGADASGDRPCVLTVGVPAADLARYAAAGADVLAEVTS